jgi:hypothetical protein
MPKRNHTPSIPPPVVAANPDNIRAVYVNNMEVHVSGWDARLAFNEIIPEGDAVRMERRVEIITSLPHFLAMVEALKAGGPRVEQAMTEVNRAVSQSKNEPKA